METCRECEFRRASSKRPCAAADRLSHLPLPILYHILSFLDTESAVQTSVLSRSWRIVWKYLPVLDFDRDCFTNFASFADFVKRVLINRYRLDVRKIVYCCSSGGVNWSSKQRELVDTVVEYALSHNAQHFEIDSLYTFTELFGSIRSWGALEFLELRNVELDRGFGSSSGFRKLTSLNLHDCVFGENEVLLDLFPNFPCLRNLVLRRCYPDRFSEPVEPVRISGLQLLSLEVEVTRPFKFEVSAPNLKSFALECGWEHLDFSDLNLPSLDYADIAVSFRGNAILLENSLELAALKLLTIFRGCRNVKSLKLQSATVEALTMIYRDLEHQKSPFHRLENLYVPSEGIPQKLADYFVAGSSLPRIKLWRY